MRAGAVDYVVKSEVALADLPHVAERALRQRRIEEALGDIVAGTSGSRRGVLPVHRPAAGPGPAGQVRLGGRARCPRGGCARWPAASTAASSRTSSTRCAGTPCGGVLDGSVCHVRHGVAEAFPGDEGLRATAGRRATWAPPCRARPASPSAWSTPIHDRPLDEVVRPEVVVQVFAVAGGGGDRAPPGRARTCGRARLRYRLLDVVASLVIVVDRRRGRDARFNRASRATGRLDRGELRAGSAWDTCSRRSGSRTARVYYRGPRPLPHRGRRRANAGGGARSGERRLIPCEVNRPVFDATGAVTYVSGPARDVTRRKRLESDLRRAAFEWRETFDGLPLGVVVVDGDGRVVRANRTAVEHSGRASLGRPHRHAALAELGPGEPWVGPRRARGGAAPGGAPAAREVSDPADRSDLGGERAGRLPTDGEGPGRVVLNFQDVTETVQLKEQLRQSETMAEIGSIVAGVAHEVRNPLFSISATLDAFESRFGRDRGLRALPGRPAGRDHPPHQPHARPAGLRPAERARPRASAAWRRWCEPRSRPARRSRAEGRRGVAAARQEGSSPGARRPRARLPRCSRTSSRTGSTSPRPGDAWTWRSGGRGRREPVGRVRGAGLRARLRPDRPPPALRALLHPSPGGHRARPVHREADRLRPRGRRVRREPPGRRGGGGRAAEESGAVSALGLSSRLRAGWGAVRGVDLDPPAGTATPGVAPATARSACRWPSRPRGWPSGRWTPRAGPCGGPTRPGVCSARRTAPGTGHARLPHVVQRIHPDDRPGFQAAVADAVARTGEVHRVQSRVGLARRGRAVARGPRPGLARLAGTAARPARAASST